MKTFLLMLFAAASVAACGGSDNMPVVGDAGTGGNASGSGSGAGASGTTTTDAFVSQVQAVIAATADNTEPVAVDATPASAPDNVEPVPISC